MSFEHIGLGKGQDFEGDVILSHAAPIQKLGSNLIYQSPWTQLRVTGSENLETVQRGTLRLPF